MSGRTGRTGQTIQHHGHPGAAGTRVAVEVAGAETVGQAVVVLSNRQQCTDTDDARASSFCQEKKGVVRSVPCCCF